MRTFSIQPHLGVEPVRLGMSRPDVHRVMPAAGRTSFRKTPFCAHETDAWYAASFQVFYGGTTPTVEFIELSTNPEIRVEYAGLDVFATPAEDVIRIITASASFDPADPELGCTYTFPSLDLALWRPVREDRFFSTIGVGVSGYFSAGADEMK